MPKLWPCEFSEHIVSSSGESDTSYEERKLLKMKTKIRRKYCNFLKACKESFSILETLFFNVSKVIIFRSYRRKLVLKQKENQSNQEICDELWSISGLLHCLRLPGYCWNGEFWETCKHVAR